MKYIFLLIFTISYSFQSIFNGSSIGAGILLTLPVAMCAVLFRRVTVNGFSALEMKRILGFALLMVALVLVHGVLTSVLFDLLIVEKAFKGILGFLGFFLLALFLSMNLDGDYSIDDFYSAAAFFVLMNVFLYHIELFNTLVDFSLPVGLFREPSHFALFSSLPLFYYAFKPNSSKFFILLMLASYSVYFFTPNLTGMLTLFMSMAIVLRRYIFLLIVVFLSLGLLSIALLEASTIDYYFSRLDFSSDTINGSVIYWMYGLERAQILIERTYGFGVGLNSVGQAVESYWGDRAVDIGVPEFLTSSDSATIAFKLFSEFGLFSIPIIFFFLRKAIGLYRSTQSLNIRSGILACLGALFIEFLMRGTGYFNFALLVFLSMMIYVDRNRGGQ